MFILIFGLKSPYLKQLQAHSETDIIANICNVFNMENMKFLFLEYKKLFLFPRHLAEFLLHDDTTDENVLEKVHKYKRSTMVVVTLIFRLIEENISAWRWGWEGVAGRHSQDCRRTRSSWRPSGNPSPTRR